MQNRLIIAETLIRTPTRISNDSPKHHGSRKCAFVKDNTSSPFLSCVLCFVVELLIVYRFPFKPLVRI